MVTIDGKCKQNIYEVLSNAKHITRLEITEHFAHNFVIINKSYKRLTHLTLHRLHSNAAINQLFFIQMNENFPKLQYLTISGELAITNSVLNYVSRLQDIKYIRLYGRQGFTQTALKSLWDNCPKIIGIHINGNDMYLYNRKSSCAIS